MTCGSPDAESKARDAFQLQATRVSIFNTALSATIIFHFHFHFHTLLFTACIFGTAHNLWPFHALIHHHYAIRHGLLPEHSETRLQGCPGHKFAHHTRGHQSRYSTEAAHLPLTASQQSASATQTSSKPKGCFRHLISHVSGVQSSKAPCCCDTTASGV